MEGKCNKLNRFVTVLLAILAMVLRAHAQQGGVPNELSWACGKECVGKCILQISKPINFALCFGLCMVGCKTNPSPALYSCTSDCASSIVSNISPGIFFSNSYL